MKPPATRLAAWIALTLVVAATLGPRVLPALDAGLAGAVELCAPAATTPSVMPHVEHALLRVPRCGVA